MAQIKEEQDKAQKKNKSAKNFRIVKIVFFILVLLLLLEGIFYKAILPGLRSTNISFVGSRSNSEAELMQILEPVLDKNWFMFDTRKAVSLIETSPAIAYATAKKVFPNSIVISITEREPVAMTFVNYGGRSIPVEIDKNGILFENRYASGDSIPIISGIPVENMSNGMRIPVKYRPLIEQIAGIRKLEQKYFDAISEICVIPKEYGTYELVLIPSFSHVRVLTDRTLNEDALQYMMVVLDVVNSIEPNVVEIDLRYGSVSYRTKL